MTSTLNTDGQTQNPTAGATLLTVKQVSEMLQVHPRTVWRLAAAGDIPKPVTLSKKIVVKGGAKTVARGGRRNFVALLARDSRSFGRNRPFPMGWRDRSKTKGVRRECI